MRINNITPTNFYVKSIKIDNTENNKPTNNNTAPNFKSITPQLYMSYNPAFTGGNSLDLSKSIDGLDKLAEKYPDVYPPNIREWAGLILEDGNPENQTLINIHKKFYESVKDCYSLKDLKEKFPEFKDVLSDDEVEYKEGTLFDDLKKGNLDYFNPEEDLSLQLIKLYWGDGFSLNDLKEYTNGHNIQHIMRKLNIPRVNPHYGQILKLSDAEYNERLTKQMAQKRMETMDRKAQQESGEPVYIPRDLDSLSEEHKKHISEGLLRYYVENPEAAFTLSERQKKYYRDNPEEAEKFHRVLVIAWKVFGADNIKKALSKFMKKNHITTYNEKLLTEPYKMDKKQSMSMGGFWASNDWAKKSFSKNMKFAWKKVKDEENLSYKVEIIPKLMIQKFITWCKNQGIDVSEFKINDWRYYPNKKEANNINTEEINKYMPKFIDACMGDESSKMANTYQLSLINFAKYLNVIRNSKTEPDDKRKAATIAFLTIKTNLVSGLKDRFGVPIMKNFDAPEIQEIYIAVLTMLMDLKQGELVKKQGEFLNESYNYLNKNWKPGQSVALKPHDLLPFI